MAQVIILTFNLNERCLYPANPDQPIRAWLYDLAKELVPVGTEQHIKYLGQDDKKRIEIQVSIILFLRLKGHDTFISHAANLRRIRSAIIPGSTWILEVLALPGIANFDNDMDDPAVQADYNQRHEQTSELFQS